MQVIVDADPTHVSSSAGYVRPVGSVIKRIALSTGGGDAPGLNAVIRAVTLAARNRDWEVVGIRDGFNGLLFPERYPDGGMIEMTRDRDVDFWGAVKVTNALLPQMIASGDGHRAAERNG